MAGSAGSSTRVRRFCGSTAAPGRRACGRTAGIPLRFVGSDRIQLGFELSLIEQGWAGHTHSEERAASGNGAARSRIP